MGGMEASSAIATAATESGNLLATTFSAEESADIERVRVADVPLAELEGLPLFEQFLMVWGTPERARLLWQQWYESLGGDTGKGVLDILVAQAVEEHGLTEEEAKRRLSVEKYLNDRGMEFAAKFMEGYRARKFVAARSLQPMAVRPKKKR
jgi:hypothetical protein